MATIPDASRSGGTLEGQQIVRLRRRPTGRETGERGHGGQALVEFALVIPILLLIFAATIQLAVIFERQIGIENAVRDAARAGAAQVTNDSNAPTNANWAYLRLLTLLGNAQGYSSAGLDLGTNVCYSNGPPDAANEGQILITVSLGYHHPLFIPLVGQILDGIDGANDGALLVSTSSQFRVENNANTQLASTACFP